MAIVIEDWIDYTKSLVWQHRYYYAHGSDYEDLVSEAYTALVKAAETFDENRSGFQRYLNWRVKCRIIDFKRKQLNLRSEMNKNLQFNSLDVMRKKESHGIIDPTISCPACIASAG
ncbi:MAG: hypothetical protein GY861_12090, partial [bacterium]|nr:hypothetical protein [bacterium]